jgi:hypothetical protein
VKLVALTDLFPKATFPTLLRHKGSSHPPRPSFDYDCHAPGARQRGLTWLETAPLIQVLPVTDARKPYPLSWEEQRLLFQALPDHMTRIMCLFKVNTGCREQDVCQLRWDWEVPVPEIDTSAFIVPCEEPGRPVGGVETKSA